MRQQINLFQDVLVDRPQPLRLKQAGTIVLLAFLVLVAFGLVSYRQVASGKSLLAQRQQQKDALAQRLEKLEEQYPEQKKDALLEAEIERVKSLLESQKKLHSYVFDDQESAHLPVVGILDEFSRQRAPGIWLTKIKLDAAGNAIFLEGSAQQPGQVPRYLQFLSAKPVMGGRVFSHLSLTQVEEKVGRVDFHLESSVGAP